MLGNANFTEPVMLDTDAFSRNAVSASVNHNGGDSITVKLTQREQAIYLTRAEIAMLAEMYL